MRIGERPQYVEHGPDAHLAAGPDWRTSMAGWSSARKENPYPQYPTQRVNVLRSQVQAYFEGLQHIGAARIVDTLRFRASPPLFRRPRPQRRRGGDIEGSGSVSAVPQVSMRPDGGGYLHRLFPHYRGKGGESPPRLTLKSQRREKGGDLGWGAVSLHDLVHDRRGMDDSRSFPSMSPEMDSLSAGPRLFS